MIFIILSTPANTSRGMFHAANIAQRDCYAGRSLMVAVGISLDGQTDLIALNRCTVVDGHGFYTRY